MTANEHARAKHTQIEAHQQGHRDGHRDREGAPRRFGQRVDHHQRQHRQQDDHDGEGPDQGGDSGDRAQFFTDQVAETLSGCGVRRRTAQPNPVLRRANTTPTKIHSVPGR